MSAYRMTVHKTTGVTPNFAMLAREVQLPASLIVKPPEEPLVPKVPFVQNFREIMRDAHIRVRDATDRSAKTQKTYYDRMSKKLTFKEGQHIWLYWPKPLVRQWFRKLWQPWSGPWIIECFKSPVVVCVRKLHGNRCRQTVNIDRILPCSSPNPNSDVTTPHGTDNLPLESQPETMELDSQDTQDLSEYFDPIFMDDSQRPTRKRRLPKHLED